MVKLLSGVLANGGVKGNPICAICGGEKDKDMHTCPKCSSEAWAIYYYLLAEERCSCDKAAADEGVIKRVSEFDPVLANIKLPGSGEICTHMGMPPFCKFQYKLKRGYINCFVFGVCGCPENSGLGRPRDVIGLVELRRKLSNDIPVYYLRVELVGGGYKSIVSDASLLVDQSGRIIKELPSFNGRFFGLNFSVGFVPAK